MSVKHNTLKVKKNTGIGKKAFLKGNIGPGTKILIWVIFAVLAVLCFSFVYPLIWALLTSFKDVVEYTQNPIGFPKSWTLSNYAEIFNSFFIEINIPGVGIVQFGPGTMLANTLILSITRPLLSTFFTTLAAYALAKYKLWGGKFLYNLGIVVMLIPIVGSFPSQMQIYRSLGIYDNIFMLIIINGGSFYGLNFLMLYAAFKRIPNDYSEAAFMDGAGHFQVMFRIMFPMILSTSAIFFFTGFIGSWNDYGTSLIWLPSHPTLAYGMYLFQQQSSKGSATVPEVLSGFLVIMIPTVILYLCVQNLIVSKLQIGGLKG